ncbi:MAG: leucyl aminopeptidase [Candidatus Kariarchaeaceae archaeon]
MKFLADHVDLKEVDVDTAVVFVFKDELDIALFSEFNTFTSEHFKQVIETSKFEAKKGEHLLYYPSNDAGIIPIHLVGLGEKEKISAKILLNEGANISRKILKSGIKKVGILLTPFFETEENSSWLELLLEGYYLGTYQFNHLKTTDLDKIKKIEQTAVYYSDDSKSSFIKEATNSARALAQAINNAKDLGNLPGNRATPRHLSEVAISMGREFPLKVTVMEKEELEVKGFGSFLSVSKGSYPDDDPRLIIMEYGEKKEDNDTIVLIGKGLTFDSGGISIKPSQGMEDMKFDMCGGSAVICAMEAIAQLGGDQHVIGIVPATDNMPSGRANKPGDVVTSLSGKTVEIISTDAEGRMILIDAITWSLNYEPTVIVDIATLTGACVIALGAHCSGMMGTNQELMDRLSKAGDAVYDRVWQLPLFEEYGKQLKTPYADIRHTGGRPAGAITAGYFLSEFTEGVPWAHLDIAGTGWTAKTEGSLTKGATGAGIRLLTELVRSWKTFKK